MRLFQRPRIKYGAGFALNKIRLVIKFATVAVRSIVALFNYSIRRNIQATEVLAYT